MTRLRTAATIATLLALTILAGCSTTRNRSSGTTSSTYAPPSRFAHTPDAVPRIETYNKGTSKPYTVLGKNYVPVKPNKPYEKEGLASWYGKKFNGKKTASGEPYNMYAMTAAHATLPIPSYARVTRVSTGKSIIVKINDRGPFHSKRIIDLSYAAAAKLGLIHDGRGKVIVQAITNDDIRDGDYGRPGNQPAGTQSTAATDQPATIAMKEAARETAADSTAPVPSLTVKTLASAKTADKPTASDSSGASSPSRGPQPRDAPGPASYDDAIYLQFGAFSVRQNAQHLVQKLNRAIRPDDDEAVHVEPGGKLYRVQLGPYPNRTTAVNAAWRIKQETGVASTITTRHSAEN